MATTYKVLGQSAPAATTDTTLYTVPASTSAIVSSIVVANRSTSDATYRIAIRPAGATIANQHYIAFDVLLSGGDSTSLTLGLTLATTDVITVRASNANLSFSAYGSEVS
jgi:glucose-6-phosphate dehydrogenase assembly protein OpcA